METRRNAMLADLARDADIERSDFLVRAGSSSNGYVAHSTNRQLGGISSSTKTPTTSPSRRTARSGRSRVFDD